MARWTLALALAGVLLARGVIPGWQETPADFVNYWLPARVIVEGGSPAAVRDDGAFSAELARRGLAPEGRASQFPPASAFVGLPWALPDVHAGARLLLLTKLALLAPVAMAGAAVARVGRRDAAIALLASGAALGNDFRFGQIYLLVLAVLLACTGGIARGGSAPAAAAVVLLAGIKVFPAIWIPFAGRRPAGAVGAVVGLVVTGGLSAAAVGPGGLLGWVRSVFVPHLNGRLGIQGGHAWAFQSVDVFARRLFLVDPVENPDPPIPWAAGPLVVKIAAFGAAAAWLVTAWRWASAAAGDDDRWRLRAGATGVIAFAVAPATASYHLLLLLAPLAWMWPAAEPRARAVLLAAVLAAGWIPYGVFFRMGEVFTPLGFPRLALAAVAAVAAGLACRRSGGA